MIRSMRRTFKNSKISVIDSGADLGINIDLKSADRELKGGDAWEKQNLCHRLYQKVGNYFPVVKNQKR